jgi:hypothetical protein
MSYTLSCLHSVLSCPAFCLVLHSVLSALCPVLHSAMSYTLSCLHSVLSCILPCPLLHSLSGAIILCPVVCPVLQSRSRPYLSTSEPDQSDSQQSRRRLFSQFSSSHSDRGEVRARATSFGGHRPQAPPSPGGGQQEGDYTQRVVAFLQQSDIIEQLQSRGGMELSEDMRSVGVVRSFGCG